MCHSQIQNTNSTRCPLWAMIQGQNARLHSNLVRPKRTTSLPGNKCEIDDFQIMYLLLAKALALPVRKVVAGFRHQFRKRPIRMEAPTHSSSPCYIDHSFRDLQLHRLRCVGNKYEMNTHKIRIFSVLLAGKTSSRRTHI